MPIQICQLNGKPGYKFGEKGMDPFFREGFEMEFTPDSPIYEQVYEHMKVLFSESKEA